MSRLANHSSSPCSIFHGSRDADRPPQGSPVLRPVLVARSDPMPEIGATARTSSPPLVRRSIIGNQGNLAASRPRRGARSRGGRSLPGTRSRLRSCGTPMRPDVGDPVEVAQRFHDQLATALDAISRSPVRRQAPPEPAGSRPRPRRWARDVSRARANMPARSFRSSKGTRGPVVLHDPRGRELRRLVGREPLPAARALAPAAHLGAVIREPGIDDPGIAFVAERTLHGTIVARRRGQPKGSPSDVGS